MTVQYQTSPETTMDIDDGGYKRLLANGSKLQYSVYALRNSPFRAATLVLGLMCIILVAVIIGQSVHYSKVGKDNQIKLEAAGGEKDNFKSQLKTLQSEKRNLEGSYEHLQQSYNYISKSTTQIKTNNNLLKAEAQQLKESQSKLQASNAALNKEIEELKTSKEQLQTNNDALSTAKDSLQTKYETLGKRKNAFQANYDSLTKERDHLQNKVNNVTRSREKLQMSYNSLMKDVEHLEERYNSSSSERDNIASSHQNLTLEKETLQAIYTTLAKATDELMASYNSTVEDKKDLESRLKNVTAERDQQRVQIINMTAEVDQLRATVTRLKDKVCPSGWKKFENNCYFASSSTKSWYMSRNYCQGEGADLVIINSREEMVFVNGLYSTNREVWLGLTDEGVEGRWKWVDGTALTLKFWADDQPNSYNGDQDCAEFWYRSSGKSEWNDEKCSTHRYWVCEILELFMLSLFPSQLLTTVFISSPQRVQKLAPGSSIYFNNKEEPVAKMTVQFQTSTETTMEIDDSGYKRLLADGSKFQYSVYALRNSPFRAATLVLGLMCIILVAVIIGQSVHYSKVGKDNQIKLEAAGGEKDNFKSQLKTLQSEKRNLEGSYEHLQQSYNYISKSTTQIKTNNNLLKAEAQQLKESQSKLQASNAALNKEIEELKTSKEQLQTNNDALSTAKDSLQTKYETLGKRKNALQANYDSLTKERDNLQNKVNNVTRSREKLQMSYNSLMKDVEHLEERYNSSSSERDNIASSHQNLTLEKETLQAIYTTLAKATDELMASYNSTVEDKKDLESRLKNVTAERDQQRVQIINMTAEVDQLRATVTRLNATQGKVCPSDWKKFENSCYFVSTSSKTWYMSRNYCQGKGADLVIINSREEMRFVNDLFSSYKEVWLGLTDEGVEGHWKWVDGTAMTLQFWGDDQPNSYNGNQDCAEFWYRSSGNAEWNDEKCSAMKSLVCEM
ncbi:uncharacterized protein LOC144020342 [Festucalex cinctus]